jgi:hypothetical protein
VHRSSPRLTTTNRRPTLKERGSPASPTREDHGRPGLT